VGEAGAVWSRLRLLILAVVGAYVFGFLGYLLFGFGVVDAFYMAALALTTLGFAAPGLAPPEKIFTATLAIFGVSLFFGSLAVLAATVAEGEIGNVSRRRRMQRQIASLRDHYIICAYGRVGRTVSRELEAEGVPFVVIDTKDSLEERMRSDGILYVIADPSSETVLKETGIDRARGLVCAVDSDAVNVFITLTARSLNPGIYIVGRASEPEAEGRLYRAGANRVVSPYATSGRHMALLVLRPRVVDYLDLVGLGDRRVRLEELIVENGSPLAGRTLREACGETVPLLIRKADGRILSNLSHDQRLDVGDIVILFGEPTALRPVEEEG
jgi:voltage-gated potassium channel